METDDKNDKYLVAAFVLLGFGILCIFIPYDSWFEGKTFGNHILNLDRYGDLGGFVSGVSAPFLSMAAFILLYKTYKSQKEELQASQLIQREQGNVLKTQQFESTFFNLLEVYNNYVKDIEFKDTYSIDSLTSGNIEITKGKACFRELFTQYSYYQNIEYYNKKIEISDDPQYQKVIIPFLELLTEQEEILGNEFRLVYVILDFVDKSTIENKNTYTSVLRSQLSKSELLFISINCINKNDNEKLKPLVEKYSLLKHVCKTSEFQELNIEKFFNKIAFE